MAPLTTYPYRTPEPPLTRAVDTRTGDTCPERLYARRPLLSGGPSMITSRSVLVQLSIDTTTRRRRTHRWALPGEAARVDRLSERSGAECLPDGRPHGVGVALDVGGNLTRHR